MKIINQRSIVEINAEKKEEAGRDKAVESLASELAAEKLKNMQKDNTIKNLSDEMVGVKLDLMKLKGGIK